MFHALLSPHEYLWIMDTLADLDYVHQLHVMSHTIKVNNGGQQEDKVLLCSPSASFSTMMSA